MNNFAGLVVIALGILVIIIGIRGTQKAVLGGLFVANDGLNHTANCPTGTTMITSGAFKGLCKDKNGVIQ